MAGVKLIVGLGNPGEEYQFSPHNLGFMVIDHLAERNAVTVNRRQSQSLCGRFMLGEEEVWLIQPQTYMNLSGTAVKSWLVKQDCGPKDLLVIADELDLPWGALRIRPRGGAAGHHGMESIIHSIGSQEFVRLRVGVCPDYPIADTVKYLLSPLKRPHRREMEQVVSRASEAVETILREGTEKSMNRFNQRGAVGIPASKPVLAEGKN